MINQPPPSPAANAAAQLSLTQDEFRRQCAQLQHCLDKYGPLAPASLATSSSASMVLASPSVSQKMAAETPLQAPDFESVDRRVIQSLVLALSLHRGDKHVVCTVTKSLAPLMTLPSTREMIAAATQKQGGTRLWLDVLQHCAEDEAITTDTCCILGGCLSPNGQYLDSNSFEFLVSLLTRYPHNSKLVGNVAECLCRVSLGRVSLWPALPKAAATVACVFDIMRNHSDDDADPAVISALWALLQHLLDHPSRTPDELADFVIQKDLVTLLEDSLRIHRGNGNLVMRISAFMGFITHIDYDAQSESTLRLQKEINESSITTRLTHAMFRFEMDNALVRSCVHALAGVMRQTAHLRLSFIDRLNLFCMPELYSHPATERFFLHAGFEYLAESDQRFPDDELLAADACSILHHFVSTAQPNDDDSMRSTAIEKYGMHLATTILHRFSGSNSPAVAKASQVLNQMVDYLHVIDTFYRTTSGLLVTHDVRAVVQQALQDQAELENEENGEHLRRLLNTLTEQFPGLAQQEIAHYLGTMASQRIYTQVQVDSLQTHNLPECAISLNRPLIPVRAGSNKQVFDYYELAKEIVNSRRHPITRELLPSLAAIVPHDDACDEYDRLLAQLSVAKP